MKILCSLDSVSGAQESIESIDFISVGFGELQETVTNTRCEEDDMPDPKSGGERRKNEKKHMAPGWVVSCGEMGRQPTSGCGYAAVFSERAARVSWAAVEPSCT